MPAAQANARDSCALAMVHDALTHAPSLRGLSPSQRRRVVVDTAWCRNLGGSRQPELITTWHARERAGWSVFSMRSRRWRELAGRTSDLPWRLRLLGRTLLVFSADACDDNDAATRYRYRQGQLRRLRTADPTVCAIRPTTAPDEDAGDATADGVPATSGSVAPVPSQPATPTPTPATSTPPDSAPPTPAPTDCYGGVCMVTGNSLSVGQSTHESTVWVHTRPTDAVPHGLLTSVATRSASEPSRVHVVVRFEFDAARALKMAAFATECHRIPFWPCKESDYLSGWRAFPQGEHHVLSWEADLVATADPADEPCCAIETATVTVNEFLSAHALASVSHVFTPRP